ncbi:MAG TPA: hypothetical protein VGL81_05165 [Polyangiaceae bacterium]|jgi:hypothetical protein
MKRVAVGLAVLLLLVAAAADAKPPPSRTPPHLPPPAPHVWVRPAPPLPMLPSVARVRVEAAHDRVILLEEVNLPRGDWRSGGLDLFVAFGAPGTPIAVDARLAPVPAGAVESRPDEPGDAVAVEPVIRHTAASQALLGRPAMAGVVLHVKDAQLRRAFALGDTVALRVRSLLSPPSADATGARDVVVRLGFVAGQPLALEKVQVVSLEPKPWIARAEATLCGPEADPWPLSVALLPRPGDPAPPAARTIAPPMAVRHASDDLCVRWWAAP